MITNESEEVIVFGATGAIGSSLIEFLSKEHPKWKIKAVTRSMSTNSRLSQMGLPNIEMVEGDPFDQESMITLSEDCSIVYCCIGFHRYETGYWAKHWPPVIDNLLAAAVSGSKQRKVVFCDNLYSLGSGTNKSIDSELVEPSLKTKPGIRSLLRQKFYDHMEKYPGTVTAVGATEFFGPRITETSFLGDVVTGKIVNNQSPLALFRKDKLHDFCYAPDLARALAVASTSKEAYDKFWICPHSIHGKTMETIVQDIAKITYNNTDEANAKVEPTVFPGFAIAMLSPFVTFMRELYQMRDFWTNDYTVDDSHFCKTFGIQATPYEDTLRSLVDFYKNEAKSKE